MWTLKARDPVVGSFDNHNKWEDYKYLFLSIRGLKDKVALDFGCGPGRAIVLYHQKFKRIDGADISGVLLRKARRYLKKNKIENFSLYKTNGVSLNRIPSEHYDLVYSTITLQHICVHDIRFNLMKEIYRVLKKGGYFTAQMGYGKRDNSVGYYDNEYGASRTNSGCDTRVDSPKELKYDFRAIGFKNFKFWIRPTGPSDQHENWIFFRGRK